MTAWKPLRTVAEYSVAGWSIELDPTSPAQSLKITHQSGAIWEALSIHPLPQHALVVDEIYVRQQDLIARFAQSTNDEYAIQVDWRLIDSDSVFELAIEVWISVWTTLLDSNPRLRVESRSYADWSVWDREDLEDVNESEWSNSPATSWSAVNQVAGLSCRSGDCSFLWLIDPSDQRQLRWISPSNSPSSSDANVQSADLFGQFLEKGVIRRARMQFLASSQSIGIEQIAKAYRQLQCRELPLTA